MTAIPQDLIRRPDGSYVALSDLEPRHALAHEMVEQFFPQAEANRDALAALKRAALAEMRAHRDMMLNDYGVEIDGKEGGFSLRSVCGRKKMELSVAKHVRFESELLAAKALLDQFIAEHLKGSDEVIVELVTSAFKLNSKGRLDTGGILGLRRHPFKHPLWHKAMDAIDDAITRDSQTVYLRFYECDPDAKTEKLVPLDISKV